MASPTLPAARVIDPPLSELGSLRTPLQQGERLFLDALNQSLPLSWEIYIQPHLNGLRPDFVLLDPSSGIAVYEVKDWDLRAIQYEYRTTGPSGRHRLWSQHNGNWSLRDRDDPLLRAERYKDEISNLYCPSLISKGSYGLITAGIVFPLATRTQLTTLFADVFKFGHYAHYSKYPGIYPVLCADDLQGGSAKALLPNSSRIHPDMSTQVAQELRHWLIEPEHSKEQRHPPALDSQQSKVARNSDLVRYRRVRGPAGSGKSLAVAARAAALAAEGKDVLVATYNITLLNYLKDQTSRFNLGRAARHIEWVNFHLWCKRICLSTGHGDDYYALWRSSRHNEEEDEPPPEDAPTSSVLQHALPELVSKILASSAAGEAGQYDAILVDEGQDYRLEWWNILRKVLKPGGEALLVADRTQDVYGTAPAWTDRAMEGAGFPGGPWFQLKGSYRLPANLMPLARKFAEQFLPLEGRDAPDFPDAQLPLGEAELTWRQVRSRQELLDACITETTRWLRSSKRLASPPVVYEG